MKKIDKLQNVKEVEQLSLCGWFFSNRTLVLDWIVVWFGEDQKANIKKTHVHKRLNYTSNFY